MEEIASSQIGENVIRLREKWRVDMIRQEERRRTCVKMDWKEIGEKMVEEERKEEHLSITAIRPRIQ